MKLFKQKRFIVPILAIMLVLACAVGAMAAVVWSTNVGGSFTVAVEPTYGLELYSNPGLTTPLTSLNWGTVYQGDSADITVYVKNVGNQAAQVGLTHNLSSSVGTITKTPTTLNIPVGSSDSMTITLTVLSDAPLGGQSPTVTVTNNA